LPAFTLEYKYPEYVTDSTQEAEYLHRLKNIADQIQAKVGEVFHGWNVAYTICEIGISSNMPDIHVIGWVTDNGDEFVKEALQAQAEILKIMEQFCFNDEIVECWFQRVKGKWGKSAGKNPRLPHPGHGCLDM